MSIVDEIAKFTPVFTDIRLADKTVRLLANFNDIYEYVKELGRGAYGKVNLYDKKDTGEQVAIKEIKIDMTKSIDTINNQIFRLNQEIYMMTELNKLTSSINRLIDSFVRRSDQGYYMCIVIEYIRGITLENHIKTMKSKLHGERIPRKTLLNISAWLFTTVNILHSNGYVHRDIKPGNIMIDTLNHRFVLIDFGMTCSLDGTYPCLNKIEGSVGYLSPEIIVKKIYDSDILKSNDVWSAGITLYELAEQELPWKQRTIKNVLSEIFSGPQITLSYPDKQLTDIIEWILNKDYTTRPTSPEIVEAFTALLS